MLGWLGLDRSAGAEAGGEKDPVAVAPPQVLGTARPINKRGDIRLGTDVASCCGEVMQARTGRPPRRLRASRTGAMPIRVKLVKAD